MLVPIAFLVIALFVIVLGAAYVAKRRAIDHEHVPDIRPDDREPTANPDLSNRPIHVVRPGNDNRPAL